MTTWPRYKFLKSDQMESFNLSRWLSSHVVIFSRCGILPPVRSGADPVCHPEAAQALADPGHPHLRLLRHRRHRLPGAWHRVHPQLQDPVSRQSSTVSFRGGTRLCQVNNFWFMIRILPRNEAPSVADGITSPGWYPAAFVKSKTVFLSRHTPHF